ncbi:MAG TPA: MerR family transcriptional regulator [Candidatus Eisenbacteria bacterium]|nr:MerR family transcriptional regulator [Candidatus Eisenbacteria bacterium]
MSTETAQLIRIGDLARETGKTVRAIHLYEELGLLHPATRSSGGFRLYERAAIERVRWIDQLHGLGFSLHEMSELLHEWWSTELGPDAMERLRALFTRKLDETRTAVARYQQLERELNEGLAYLETCRACATPDVKVNGCVHCGQDHGMAREPALVAGITLSPERGRRAGRGGLVRVQGTESST